MSVVVEISGAVVEDKGELIMGGCVVPLLAAEMTNTNSAPLTISGSTLIRARVMATTKGEAAVCAV